MLEPMNRFALQEESLQGGRPVIFVPVPHTVL